MPVVGAIPYSQGTDITTLVRALCNDQQGQLFTDQILLPYVNSAYRQIQIALANVGMQTFTEDEDIVTIPAVTTVDPGQQVWLAFTGIGGNVTPSNEPVLDQNLIEPIALFERITGSTDQFIPMLDLTSHGGLPSVPQGFRLRFWEWRQDQINFVGATNSTDIRIRSKIGMQPFNVVNGVISGTLLILGALDAVAYTAAAMALTPRGSPLAEGYDTAAGTFTDRLKTQVMRDQQHAGPFRRRGFSTRNRSNGYNIM
jgi:hypothetical protein